MSTRVKRHSTSDLMDDWLESQGYYRKLIAKDSSCLFRAVSEQLFNTQILHGDVRNKCVDYMEENNLKFEMLVDNRSFENYIANIRNPKEWGGQVEITAMSSLFKADFSVFQEVGKALYKITDNNYDKTIILCQSSGNHFDSVYPNSFIQNAAISQSIVYEILYKKVFALGDEVDFAVSTMLHDKAYAKSRKDSTASVDSNTPLSLLDFGESSDDKDSKEPGSEIRQSLARGFPPFPYKVAKALDPDIYRNVEYDVWNETKKEEIVYEPGVKCLVRLETENSEAYHAHIQEILPDCNSVTVYIVELGKKQTVGLKCLEPLPMCKSPASYVSGSFYQKQKGTGSPNEMELHKGKKKLLKKNKYKELQFSVTHSRGQSIPPRFQPQNQQQSTTLNNITNASGRDRQNSYPGINNTSSNLKWSSTSSPNASKYRRYSERFQVQNLPYSSQENNFKQQSFSRPNERFIVQPSSSPSTAGNWNKSNGLIATSINSRKDSINGESCTELMPQEVSNESSVQASMNSTSKSKVVSTTYNNSNLAVSNASNQSPPNQENVTTIASSPMIQPSPPIAIYPYQYVGVCLPYETPIQSINYGTPRSRDPQGGDLPLHDLATLRFFFNLGHDYFRSAAIIPMPNNQCQSTVWSYGPQLSYQPIGGYGTPVSSIGNESESMTDSSPPTGTSLTLSDPGCEGLLDNSPKEFYEPTYLYDISHVNMMPNNFQPPVDFSLPPPPQAPAHSGLGEFKGGLVLNEQGILSLNNNSTGISSNSNTNPQNYPVQNNNSSRFRSDSSSSNRSQRNNNNNSKWNKSSGNNKSSNANYFNEGNAYSSSKLDHGNTTGGNNQWSPRYPPRANNGSKQTSSLYANHQVPSHYQAPRQHPPLMPLGTPQPATNFSLMQTGSPIMTAASPNASLGVFANHGNPTPYYGSSPTQTLYYPHLPQQISYMTASSM